MPKNKEQFGPTDAYVGKRIRMRRIMMGMSQEKLGDALGITFQQIQKYEKGTNRVSASKLQATANVLDVPVAFFFEGGPHEKAGKRGTSPVASFANLLATKEGVELCENFEKIEDSKIRRCVLNLIELLAQNR